MKTLVFVLVFVVSVEGFLNQPSGTSSPSSSQYQNLMDLLIDEKHSRRQLESTVTLLTSTVTQLTSTITQLKQEFDALKSQYQQALNQNQNSNSSGQHDYDKKILDLQSEVRSLRTELNSVKAANHTSLPGPKGDRGDAGITGPSGPKGNPGIKGTKGDMGMKGDTGIPGIKGERGLIGPQGQKGSTGQNSAHEITKIRLAGSPSSIMGRVEVYHNGEWGTICDDHWSETDATVVCRTLGFKVGSPYSSAHFGQGSGRIWLDDVQCDGTETSLSYCRHLSWGQNNCSHSSDAGVTCGNLRLAASADPFKGRVEVYHNGKWGTICNDFWSTEAATVTCATLGLYGGQTYASVHGSEMFSLYGITCTGSEPSLDKCQWYGEFVKNTCSQSSRAGVQCANLRLVNSSNRYAGRVEIFHDGEWGTICDDNWSTIDSQVVCKMLGHSGGTAYASAHYGAGSGRIWLDDMRCSSSSTDIGTCTKSSWGSSDCTHKEDAGVSCNVTRLGPVDPRHLVRLAGGENWGRVEVIRGGRWGTVCDDDWDNNDASVICRMLGLRGGLAHGNAYFGPGDGEIWLDDVACTGSEIGIDSCQHRAWGTHDCTHGDDAGVTCI